MKLTILCSLIGSSLLIGCATTNLDLTNMSNSTPLLNIQNNAPLNKAKELRKKDVVLEVIVSPQRTVHVVENVKIDTEGDGFFKLSAKDTLFLARSEKFGEIYCGTTNIHRNSSKTLVNQGCLGDTENDGYFDTFLVRAGASHKDAPGFVYYNAEIADLAPPADFLPIKYQGQGDSEQHSYHLAFRFMNMKKRNGGKVAIFDILTRKIGETEWSPFFDRDPIEVSFATDNAVAIYQSSLFTAEFSNPTPKSVDATITSVAANGSMTMKRATDDSTDKRYKPAYQITGTK